MEGGATATKNKRAILGKTLRMTKKISKVPLAAITRRATNKP